MAFYLCIENTLEYFCQYNSYTNYTVQYTEKQPFFHMILFSYYSCFHCRQILQTFNTILHKWKQNKLSAMTRLKLFKINNEFMCNKNNQKRQNTTKENRREGDGEKFKMNCSGKDSVYETGKNLHKDSSRPINEVPEIPEIW